MSTWETVVPEWQAVHPPPEATLSQVADHIEHVRAVAGLGHVGIGGDYDGSAQMPAGLADVSGYPALFAELLARGWTETDCAALAGGNLLRVLRDAEKDAATWPQQRRRAARIARDDRAPRHVVRVPPGPRPRGAHLARLRRVRRGRAGHDPPRRGLGRPLREPEPQLQRR